MVRLGNDVFGNIFHQCFLCLQRVLAVRGQPESFGDAEDMCVHGHGWLVPDHRTHHIRGLATHSLQRLQVLDVIRHIATKCSAFERG